MDKSMMGDLREGIGMLDGKNRKTPDDVGRSLCAGG